MPFSTIERIRQHTGWVNSDRVSDALITQRLSDAHCALLQDLSAEWNDSEDAMLVLVETELASAYILRSLAAETGYNDQDLRTPFLSSRSGNRSTTLQVLADEEEARAWGHARPFLRTNRSIIPLRLVRSEGVQ